MSIKSMTPDDLHRFFTYHFWHIDSIFLDHASDDFNFTICILEFEQFSPICSTKFGI